MTNIMGYIQLKGCLYSLYFHKEIIGLSSFTPDFMLRVDNISCDKQSKVTQKP